MYENFDDPSSGFPIQEDSTVAYAYVNGEYQIMLKQANLVAAVRPNYTIEDFNVGVQVRNPNNTQGIYGLMFNVAEDWSHMYTFEIDSEGHFGIWRYSDARGWKLLLVDHSQFINQGPAANNLKVRRVGEQIDVYANSHLLTSIRDSSYMGNHYLGLIATSFEQGYLDVRFDNFYITPGECQNSKLLSSPKGLEPSQADHQMYLQKEKKSLH